MINFIDSLTHVTSRFDKYVSEKSSRKVTNRKGAFSSVDSIYKLLYLRIEELKDKWNKPIPNWKKVRLQLAEIYGERFTKYLDI